VAGAITSSIHEDGTVTLRAIGAGAVNQALKATVSARQHLAGGGFDMVVRPGMVKVPGKDNTPVTAMVLHCRLT
jgi:stage V sporulation protein S